MSYTGADRPFYYPEEHDYSLYFQNEFHDYGDPAYNTTSLSDLHSFPAKKPVVLPTINYLNERKCPIYIHHIRNDSSIYNNYGQKSITPKKKPEHSKVVPQNASKFVLDKLEETYWATWKPKKENLPVKKSSPRKVPDLGLSDSKPMFRIHNKDSKKPSYKPHGDVNNNIIKYFKTKDFESSTTGASVDPHESGKNSGSNTTTISVINENKKSNRRLTRPRKFGLFSQRDSISQEIQTEVHCPVILEQINEDVEEDRKMQMIFEMEKETHEDKVEIAEGASKESTNQTSKKENKAQKQPETKNNNGDKSRREEKSKKQTKNIKKSRNKSSEMQNLADIEEDSKTFVDIKDSVEIAKEKQEKSPKEHYQQPKCIRLYRKSGGTSGFIKGGTYPLKSCLKKDSFPKGNFRLGAPGSPLFVTTSSFSNRRKK